MMAAERAFPWCHLIVSHGISSVAIFNLTRAATQPFPLAQIDLSGSSAPVRRKDLAALLAALGHRSGTTSGGGTLTSEQGPQKVETSDLLVYRWANYSIW